MRPSDAVAGEETAAAVTPHDGESQIDAFRDAVRRGRPWFNALLALIADWDLPAETVDGREYRYLIGGEAFDWLLLAERVCNAVEAERLLPQREVEALLLAGEPPQALAGGRPAAAAGAGQISRPPELPLRRPGGGSAATGGGATSPEGATQRRAGQQRAGGERDLPPHLRRRPRRAAGRVPHERNQPLTDRISLTELREFTYWLFKRRLAVQDPARVASDTRRGLLMLQRLEELKGRRPIASVPPEDAPLQAVDSVALPVR